MKPSTVIRPKFKTAPSSRRTPEKVKRARRSKTLAASPLTLSQWARASTKTISISGTVNSKSQSRNASTRRSRSPSTARSTASPGTRTFAPMRRAAGAEREAKRRRRNLVMTKRRTHYLIRFLRDATLASRSRLPSIWIGTMPVTVRPSST